MTFHKKFFNRNFLYEHQIEFFVAASSLLSHSTHNFYSCRKHVVLMILKYYVLSNAPKMLKMMIFSIISIFAELKATVTIDPNIMCFL